MHSPSRLASRTDSQARPRPSRAEARHTSASHGQARPPVEDRKLGASGILLVRSIRSPLGAAAALFGFDPWRNSLRRVDRGGSIIPLVASREECEEPAAVRAWLPCPISGDAGATGSRREAHGESRSAFGRRRGNLVPLVPIPALASPIPSLPATLQAPPQILLARRQGQKRHPRQPLIASPIRHRPPPAGPQKPNPARFPRLPHCPRHRPLAPLLVAEDHAPAAKRKTARERRWSCPFRNRASRTCRRACRRQWRWGWCASRHPSKRYRRWAS